MTVKVLRIALQEKTLVDITFEIKSSLALVGQSGSGKSLTLKALLGLLPSTMQCTLDIDTDILLKRGESLAFVPQNPFTALSPLSKIKKQFFINYTDAAHYLKLVNLDTTLLERFPAELSGGQLQRVIIAMALSSRPKLLLLDEPTTALDPETTDVIIQLLKSLQEKLGFKLLFVTHDMHSASKLCNDICVIKNGLVQEFGEMQRVISDAQSPYTRKLIDATFSNRKFRT